MENNSQLYKKIFDLTNVNRKLKHNNAELNKVIKKLNNDLSLERKKNDLLEKKCKTLEENMNSRIQVRVQAAINETTQHLTAHYESVIRKKEKQIVSLEKVSKADANNSSTTIKKICE